MFLLYSYTFYYIFALIGISIGYHRYFSHKSFRTSVAFECVMLYFGMLCGGRSPLTWAAVHRMHHSTSDTAKDPHSPIFKGIWQVIFSRWSVDYIPRKYILDLMRNPRVMFFHRYGVVIHLSTAFLILMTLGLYWLVILIIMPYIFSYMAFGLLNYITHRSGEPTDVPLLNLIAPGEGWHKYHHENPRESRLNRWDPAGFVIRLIT